MHGLFRAVSGWERQSVSLITWCRFWVGNIHGGREGGGQERRNGFCAGNNHGGSWEGGG